MNPAPSQHGSRRHIGLKLWEAIYSSEDLFACRRRRVADGLRLVAEMKRHISVGTMNPKSKSEPNRRDRLSPAVSLAYRRRIDAGLRIQIGRLERCRKHLARIDPDVFRAGMSCFESAHGFALWLSGPAIGLGGKVPIQVMRSAEGRKEVASLLRRIDYGVY